MKKLILIASLGAALASGPALAKKREMPVASPTGAAVDCIPISQIRESRVRSDSVIDFRTGGKKWYRNTLPNSCPSLGFEERFSYRTSLSQLCAVDTIAVLQTYGGQLQEGPRCGLGKFQPVELAKASRK
jgi:hypothetical protein